MQSSRTRGRVCILIVSLAACALLAGGVAFVHSGVYNVGADDPHLPATSAVLEQLRDASVEARASKLQVPRDLMTPARITQGAGNYDAMCTQCHLAPGMSATELSRGLYPAPPDLTRETVEAAEAFWVIKHGIKASGMPAWGGSMGDAYIWNMAAFLQELPKLDAARYRTLVASSGGHSHGGGETMRERSDRHGDTEMGSPAAHDDGPTAPRRSDAAHAEAPVTGHAHAPGTPAHDDGPPTPDHVDPPGAPPHTH